MLATQPASRSKAAISRRRAGSVGLRGAFIVASLLWLLAGAAAARAQVFVGPVALDTNAATDTGGDDFAQVTTDGAGSWVTVWTSFDNTDDDILVSRSSDAGATWTAPVALHSNATTDLGSDRLPQVTADGVGTWLAGWHSDDTLGGTLGTDFDVLESRSTDAGMTWTAPAALHGNATTDTGDDAQVQVTTDGAGSWVAVWESNDSLGATIGTDFDILVARALSHLAPSLGAHGLLALAVLVLGTGVVFARRRPAALERGAFR